MSRRYAIYYPPPAGSPLEAFGRSWIGRDHVTSEPIEPPAVEGLSAARQRNITAFPRVYGFHATLKAPFELAPERTRAELVDALEDFARSRMRLEAPPLELQGLSGFIAFTLSAPAPEMDALAAACVESFEPFRAPPGEGERARRRASGLTPRQERYLGRWGYPYVMEEFRFHMTLTGRLEQPERTFVLDALRPLTRHLSEAPLPVHAIGLYEQPSRDEPFVLTRRFALG